MGNVIHMGRSGPQTQVVLDDLVDDFLAELRVANKSQATLKAYASDLHKFRDYYKGEIGAVTPQILRDYLLSLESLSPATRARRRASLRAFFDWAVKTGHLEASPADRLPGIKLPESQPRAVASPDLERVLSSIKDKRDALLFRLMADTGLRVSEALSIRLESIRLYNDDLTVVGKGGRERTVYLIKTQSLRLLRNYLRVNGWLGKDGKTITERGLLLRPDEAKQRCGRPGQPIHYTVVQKAWRDYCQQAGLEGVTIHQLRHSCATRLINEGKPVEVVQKILGHRNLQTTMRYAVVSDETVRRALAED